jgi:PAS domain S-box-containing protein
MNSTAIQPKNPTFTTPRFLVATFALALAGVLAGGAWFYRTEAALRRQQIIEELQSVAKLKVKQLVAWRSERLGDGFVLMQDSHFALAIAGWMREPDPKETQNILNRFRSLADNYHYSDVALVDPEGHPRLSLSGHSSPLDDVEMQGMAAALRERRAVLIDVHLAPGNESPKMDVVAPYFKSGGGTEEPVGAVLLEIDAAQFLFPVVQSWPTPSPTAETTLFRREGRDVLVLAELRHTKGAALKLRIPLSRVEVPSVMAALGRRGLADGVDYRGVKVLAVLDAIPDSPWLLITKIDADEASGGWRRESRYILLLVLLVAVVLAAVGYVWLLRSTARVRDRAGELVRRSEEKFAKAFQSSPMILVLNRISDGRMIEANDAFERLMGYTREEALGRTMIELKIWVNEAERARLLLVFSSTRRLRGEEVKFRAKDGSIIIGLLFAELIEVGGEECILASVDNITERKQLEQQFLQAQKMEAIGHLAGGVAHDFNNILAALMMGLELIDQDSTLDQDAQALLKELTAETKRACNLTRQLLMLSRRSVLDVRVLDVNEVAANLLNMLGRLLGEHITLVFERKNTLPAVEADTGMLEQVLMNLVVNSRDAMPKGGRITLSTDVVELGPEQVAGHAGRRAGRFACLAVTDTGCGMDPDTQKRLFEPFFTTKATGKGTGLGLATVYGIIAQHKGWVEVESEVGRGSTFRIYLEASSKAAAAPEEQIPAAIRRGQGTLLVVEDDATVRLMLVQSLRVLGYRVFAAANGQEAMHLWRSHGPQVDLLLTDMVMPEGMTGLELAERVQAEKPGLKVIISSGYSAEITKLDQITAKGIFYLPKPFEIARLGAVLRHCLESSLPLP